MGTGKLLLEDKPAVHPVGRDVQAQQHQTADYAADQNAVMGPVLSKMDDQANSGQQKEFCTDDFFGVPHPPVSRTIAAHMQ